MSVKETAELEGLEKFGRVIHAGEDEFIEAKMYWVLLDRKSVKEMDIAVKWVLYYEKSAQSEDESFELLVPWRMKFSFVAFTKFFNRERSLRYVDK